MAVTQVAAIIVLWRLGLHLAARVKDLQTRAEALERLVRETADRVGATADDIGRTARSVGQAAGAVGRVLQGAGVGAFLVRRLLGGASPVAVAAGEAAGAAAGAARMAAVKAGLELAALVARAVAARRGPVADAGAAGNPAAGGRARRAGGETATRRPRRHVARSLAEAETAAATEPSDK